MRALIDSSSKVNVITPAYAVELGLTTWKTSVGAQKIDGLPLETYSMALSWFSIQDSLKRVWFFEETFLLTDISIEIVLGMLFLSLSNANIEFAELENLTWRLYTEAEALSTTSRVELIHKREFAKAALNKNSETFVVHVAALELPTAMPIHVSRALQVLDDPMLVDLQWDKAPIKIPAKYSSYADVFFSDLAMELPENTEMNEHTIKLIEGK